MKAESENISLSFNQLLKLILQLPTQQKIKISKELEKEGINSKLSKLMSTFKTDELPLNIIDEEAEAVRKELYAKSKKA